MCVYSMRQVKEEDEPFLYVDETLVYASMMFCKFWQNEFVVIATNVDHNRLTVVHCGVPGDVEVCWSTG